MSLFKRKEKIHFERDEEGNVVRTVRTGDVESRTPVSDKLLKQQQLKKKGPSKFIKVGKKIDRAIVRFNRRQPVRGSGYSTHNNYNPFGSMFDSGMSSPKSKSRKPKKTGKTKYVIRSGKAYPIVGTSKKKKKTVKRDPFDFDTFDNWKFK